MLEAVVAFFVYIVESFTGSVLENSPTTPCGSQNFQDDNSQIEPLLIQQRSTLEDFTNFDPNDAIFQEFDPPLDAHGSMAWKESRPSGWTSFVSCFRAIFLMQLIIGSSIGLLAIAVAVVDFNTADLCYEKTFRWNSMPRVIQSIRVTSQSVEGFIIELWHFSIMLCMFGYSILKDLNLLTINLLAAFLDASYRLCLQVFGIYKQPWMSYPLNVLFSLVVFGNSIIIAKHLMSSYIPVQEQTKKKLLKMTFLLGLQFFVGIPAAFVLVYWIFPWYNSKSEMEKAFIAGACPLLLSLPKVIARALAPKFELVHPGLLYLLVGCLYSSSAIVFRVMQAELTSFGLFVALGVGHAVIDLVERLTVTMRDYIWDFMYKILFRCNRSQTVTLSPRNSRTPRSMRFVADVSIQLLLTEATALVSAVGFIQVYKFMYPDVLNQPVSDLIWGFIERCATGLAIDVVFNTVSVFLQVTLFNVAVLKVWNSHNWRAHVIANVVFTLMSALYFTEYLFAIIRTKNDHHTAIRFAFNCSLPFSRNS
ncbi:uncharacterized protein [Montipora foliosa]|uniref:uncharacterized protein n=1 Tax=Montipora foliosa TaxID=591990 RepID=UPI0035F1FB7F